MNSQISSLFCNKTKITPIKTNYTTQSTIAAIDLVQVCKSPNNSKQERKIYSTSLLSKQLANLLLLVKISPIDLQVIK